MKTLRLFAIVIALPLAANAGEHVTLTAENSAGNAVDSSPITLNPGDTAELKFAHHLRFRSTGDTWILRMVVSTGGKEYEIPAVSTAQTTGGTYTYSINPIKIAGPAVIKMRVGDGGATPAGSGFSTLEVTRAGTATSPVPIPAEAGTTWQVVLESSSDLVNWTAVMPGDYPSSTPQRYFRTRLIRK